MTVENQPEARSFTRVGVRMEIALEAGNAGRIDGHIRNVSASGIFVETDAGAEFHAEVDSECRIVLGLDGGTGPLIRATARIVRADAHGVAVRITEVDGPDSFVHLRNLVLYNAEDADAAVAEFDAHVGLKPWE